MLNTVPKSRPSLMVRPTTIKPSIQSTPQIIVIPQSMFSGNGIKTVFSIAGEPLNKPTLTRVIKPSVPIVNNRPIETNRMIVNSRPIETNRMIVSNRPIETNRRTITLKRPLPQSSPHSDNSGSGSEDDSKMEEMYTDENGQRVRKRANLDHLSQEEKMMRRKLKNRVAAQNARDKKRVKMDDMEVTIRQLQQQNKKLAKQNEELLALNRRLMAENEGLKSNRISTESNTVFVKQELDLPYSPESLHPPQSHTPPLSSDEDDEVMMSPALPLEAVDMSSVPTSNSEAIAAIAERRSSSVSNRLLAPAEPTNVLQQQEQSRSQAEERETSNATAASAPEQLACLLWMCLLNPSKTSQTTSQPPETATQSPESSSSTPQVKNNLPPKKRGNWWGSQPPFPNAKT